VAILYGSFLQAIINFLLVAFCVFVMIRAINRVKDTVTKKEKEEAEKAAAEAAEAAAEAAPEEPSEEILLLREIRDSLKK
ncbi:MAG: MscL family protein, partial [Eubacteriales bacterium]